MTGPMLRERLRDAGVSAWELATYSASTRTGAFTARLPAHPCLEGSPTMPAPSTRVNTGRRPAATPPRRPATGPAFGRDTPRNPPPRLPPSGKPHRSTRGGRYISAGRRRLNFH